MRVNCFLCGKVMSSIAKNAVHKEDGQWMHKICSQGRKLTDEEEQQRKKLTDRIKELAILHEKPLPWLKISRQIADNKDMGYDYDFQLYTLNYVYELDGNVFWGYGRTSKFFEHALAQKQKKERIKNMKATEELEISALKYKPTKDFMEV